jgi:hypothetical protein
MAELTGAELHPGALAEVQPLLDHLESDPALQFSFYMALLSLITEEISEFSTENQGYYAAWLSGTMDFMIQPLPIDDEVHTVSKISALWGIPRPEEAEAAGMPHALLGWTGNTTTLGNFVYLFDALGGGDGPNWAEEELEPLVEYIYSLRAPTTPVEDEASALRGGQLFSEAGCIDCHAGPRGSGIGFGDLDMQLRPLPPAGEGRGGGKARATDLDTLFSPPVGEGRGGWSAPCEAPSPTASARHRPRQAGGWPAPPPPPSAASAAGTC